jgi:hypothetical protein
LVPPACEGRRFYISSLLMASTMVSFNSFAYICSVILVDECPHTLDTIPMFIPLFNSKVAGGLISF